MNAKSAVVGVAVCAGVAGAASPDDPPRPEPSPAPAEVRPLRCAPVAYVDGRFRVAGEWRECGAVESVQRSCTLLWDAYQPYPCTSLPNCAMECDFGDGCRWFFGTTYANPFSVNDMSMDPGDEGTFATRAAWMWWWGQQAECYVGILTSDEFITESCDSTINEANGWVFALGILGYGAWRSEHDFGIGSPDGWAMPASGDGSNAYFLADGFDGEFFHLTEFNAHFILWGTSDDGGLPDRPGTNGPQQHDDDDPIDGEHTMPSECHMYDFGVCPDPLCNTMCFWGERADEPCYVDCNGDTVVNSLDVLCFLNLYAAGDPAADCNGDTIVNSLDVLCFLNLFVDPPCP